MRDTKPQIYLRGLITIFIQLLLCVASFGQSSLATIPSATNDSILLCIPGDNVATFAVNNGTGPYSWTFPGGSPSSATGAGTHTITYPSAGTYTATINAPNDPNMNGHQVTVIVGSPPTVGFSPSDTLFCDSDAPDLMDGAFPGGGYFTGPGVSGHTFDPAAAGIGTHTITYHYQNGSCTGTATQQFLVMGTPNTSLAAQGTPILFDGKLTYSRCVPANSTFNFYTTTNSSTYTSYSIDFGDGSAPQTGTTFPTPAMAHAFPNIGQYEVVLTLYGANGCPSHDTIVVFYGSNPSVGLSTQGNNIKCLPRDSTGITFWFPVTGYQSNPPGTIYVVEVNDGSPPQYYNHPPPDSIGHTFFEPSCGYQSVSFNDAFMVKITAQTPCQPHSAATVEPIYISDPPTAAFTAPERICIGNVALINDASWGSQNALTGCDTNVLLVWEISPSTFTLQSGSLGATFNDPYPGNWIGGTEQLAVMFQRKGFYTVKQFVGNQAGCEVDTMEMIICVDSIPDPDFELITDTLCAPDTVKGHYLNHLISLCDTSDLQWDISPPGGHTIISSPTDSVFEAYFYEAGNYTITVTANNMCGSASFSRVINVGNEPSILMEPDQDFCGLQTIDISDPLFAPTKYDSLAPLLSHQWDIYPGSGWTFINGTNASSEFPEIDFTTYGTYQLVYSITNRCGTYTDTMELSFWEIPTLDPLPDTLICYNSDFGTRATVQGGNAPYTWEWYTSASAGVQSTSDSIFLTGITSATTVSVVVTDSAGCSDTTDFEITTTAPLAVNAGPDQTICYTDTAYLNATPSGGSAPYTYAWSPNIGLNDPTLQNPFRTPLDSTIAYTVTITDAKGCTATDQVIINVTPIINLDAGPDFTLCHDSVLYPLTSQSHNGGTWSGPGVSAGNFDPITAGLGTHRLYYNYIDAGGCAYIDSLEITVISIPEANFSLSQMAGCSILETQVHDSSTAGVSHFWYIDGVLTSNQTNPLFSLVNNSNTNDRIVTIKLIVTAGTGCKDSIQKTVTVYPNPQAVINTPSSICANDSVQISSGSVFKGTAKYEWYGPGNVTISNDTIAAPYFGFPDNQSGIDSVYTIGLVVTSIDGCIDTIQQNIIIYSRPVADFGLPANACAPVGINPINASIGTGLSYNWAVTPAITINNPGSANPTFNFPAVAADSAIYTINLFISDDNGCIDTTFKTYTVYPSPTADFTTSVNDSCGPMEVNFHNWSTSNISNQHLKDLTIDWDFGNGQTSNDSLPVVTFLNNGVNDTNYTVTLTVTNQFGCTDVFIDTITVHPDPFAGISVRYWAGCAPFNIDTSAVKAISSPNANLEYYWIITDMGGNLLKTDTGLYSLDYVLATDGDSVNLRLITTSPYGCLNDTLDAMFYTIQNPTANFAILPDSGCTPLTVVMSDSSTTGVLHDWFINGILFSQAISPSLTLVNNSHTQDSVAEIKLVIMSGTGCIDSATEYVTIHPKPLADFSIAANSCPADTLTATNNTIGKGALSYSWSISSPTVWVSNPNDANPSFGFPDNQSGVDSVYTITLISTSEDGCTDTTTQNVTIFARPVANFNLPAAACAPFTLNPIDNSTGNNISYSWSISPSVPGNNLGTSAPSFNLPITTNDSVQYTVSLSLTDANGCTDTISKKYTVYPVPTAGFSMSVADTCSPYAITFTNTSSSNQVGMGLSSMSYNWDFGNGQGSTDSIPSTTYVNNGTKDTTYYISLYVTNAFGCTDLYEDSITIHPDPVASINFSSTVSCAPFVIDSTVVNAVSYSSANSQYNWRVLDAQGNVINTFSGLNSVSHTITAPADTVILELTAVSPFGCKTDTATRRFYTIENPVARFTPVPVQACSPVTVTVLDSSSTGANKTWYVNGQFFANGNNPVFNFVNNSITQDSIITIKVVVEAGTGCKDSVEHQVTIYPKPIADFSIAANSCPGDTLIATNTSSGKAPLSYSWSISSSAVWISDTAAANPSFGFPDNQSGFDSTYTITLITYTADGCSDTATNDVIIFARPVADFSLPANACSPQILAPVDLSTGNNMNYSWGISPSVISSGLNTSTPQFELPLSTNDSVQYTIHLALTNANGCVDTITKYYTVYPKPVAGFVPSNNDSCGPFTVSFANTSLPNQTGMNRANMSFFWDFGNGQTSTDSMPTVVYNNIGFQDSTYFVQLISTNAWGCSDTISDSITVHPDPIVSYTLSTASDCAPFEIDTTVINHTHHAGANSGYSWDFVDVNTGLVVQSFSNSDSINYTLPLPGDSIILRTVAYSPYGCKIDTVETLLFALGTSLPGFVASDYEGCHPLTVNFTDTVPGFNTWSWLIDGQLVSSIQNPSYTFTNSSTTADSTYEVQMIATTGLGCTDTVTQYITVFAQMVPGFNVSPNCMGDTTHFSNTTQSVDSIVSWHWDFGDGQTDSTENPIHRYANPGVYVVNMMATNHHGCIAGYIDTVTIYPRPVANFVASSACGNDTLCKDQTFTLQDFSTLAALGGNITAWSWDINADGTVEYTTQNPLHTFTAIGNYPIRLIVTSQYGCTDTVERTVEVNEIPVAYFSIDSATGCGPVTTTVTDSSFGNIETHYWEVYTKNWAGARTVIFTSYQANPGTLPTFLPKYTADTTYYISYTVGNCCGSYTHTDSLVLTSIPIASMIPSIDQGCNPLSVSFQLDGPVSGQPEYLVLDYGDGTVDTLYQFYQITPNGDTAWVWGQPTHIFNNPNVQDTTYTVTLTTVNKCGDSSVTADILVYPTNAQAFINASPAQGCAPLTVTLKDASYGGINTSWCLDYDTATGTCNQPSALGDSIVYTYNTPGTYVVAQFVDDGCSLDTAFKVITVYPSPTADFTHTTPACEDGFVSFTDQSTTNSSGISGYFWDFGDGQTSFLQNPVHQYTSPGTFNACMVVMTAGGCMDSICKPVTIYGKPEINFSATNECVNEQPIAFFDSSSVAHGQIISTLWKFGDGNTSVSANPVHTYAAPGMYTVTLIHSSTYGCTDSSTQVVNVFPTATADFEAGRTFGKACGAPQNFSFTNLSVNAAGYYWDFDYYGNRGQHTSTLTNPGHIFQTEGVYTVMLIATNTNGCSDTMMREVIIRPFPKAGFAGNNFEGCAPLTVDFTDTTVYNFPQGGIVNWTWDFGDGTVVSGSPNVTHTYTVPGNYAVSLMVENDGGCIDTMLISNYIHVLPTPIANFEPHKIDAKTFQFTNLTQYVNGSTTFEWDFGDGNTSTAFEPEHRYNVNLLETDYEFEVCLKTANAEGCGDTICTPLKLTGYELYTPNAFAPDLAGTGAAMYFLPAGHSMKTYHLYIFDEWGNIIFESTSLDESGIPNEPWDGTHMETGTELPLGAYVWKIDAEFTDGTTWEGQSYGKNRKNYGTVTLIR